MAAKPEFVSLITHIVPVATAIALAACGLWAEPSPFRHAAGFSFTPPESWTLSQERVDDRSEGILLRLRQGKEGFAGISVQTYRTPYPKAGVGTWMNGQDYLQAIKADNSRINALLVDAFGPGSEISRISPLPDVPEFRDYPGLSISRKDSKSVILVVDRSEDFLVVVYEASPDVFEAHWLRFLAFLKSFEPK